MNELPETFQLESIEQMRVIADELRQRILKALVDEPMTVTQLGEQLEIAPAKIHYHVRELEHVGLVKLVDKREKGGILEKYYRTVARDISYPMSLLQSLSADDLTSTLGGYLNEVSRGFLLAARRQADRGDIERAVALSMSHIYLTDEEVVEATRAINEALESYRHARGVSGERERTFVQLMYDTRAAAAAGEEAAPPGSTFGGLQLSIRRRIVVAGAVSWNRADLERVLAEGEALDVAVLGVVTFADDVPADLVDRAIRRFRHRGPVRASPGVKAVLRQKEKAAQQSP